MSQFRVIQSVGRLRQAGMCPPCITTAVRGAVVLCAVAIAMHAVSATAGSGFQFPSWFWQNPLPTGDSLAAVSYYDENIGMAVGRQGSVVRTVDGGRNWFSTNPETRHCERFTDIEMIGPQTAVATSQSNCTGLFSAWRTVDSGHTWEQKFDSGLWPNGVSFIDDSIGMIAGSNINFAESNPALEIWTTDDGGVTWDHIQLQTEVASVFGWHGFILVDENTAFLAGLAVYVDENNEQTSPIGPAIIGTYDGGQSWEVVLHDTDEVFPPVTGLYSDFALTADGRIVATGLPGVAAFSDDNGQTWVYAESLESFRALRAVSCSPTDPNICVAAGGEESFNLNAMAPQPGVPTLLDGTAYATLFDIPGSRNAMNLAQLIARTTDGGESWNIVLERVGEPRFTDIDYSGEGVLTLVGDHALDLVMDQIGSNLAGKGGRILTSTDDGLHWTERSSSVTDNIHLNNVHFATALNGVVVGQHGAILRTVDGGQTWEGLDSGTDHALWDAHFFDSQMNTGVVVGGSYAAAAMGQGVILRTVDGGETWSSYVPECKEVGGGVSGWSCSIESLSCIDNQRCVALGVGTDDPNHFVRWSALFLTEDGGESWERVHQNVPQVRSVDCTDDGYCFAAGGNNLWVSIDGGHDWTQSIISSPSLSTIGIQSIATLDEQELVAVGRANTGFEGLILKSQDGGVSWTEQVIGIDCPTANFCVPGLSRVKFANNDLGVAVGAHVVAWTADGGETWFVEQRGDALRARARGLALSPEGIATIVGRDGEILRTAFAPDFQLQMQPRSASMCLPDSGSEQREIDILVNPLVGYAGSVSLAASNLPPGVSAVFEPADVVTPGASTATLAVTSTTLPGRHDLQIIGTDGNINQSVNFILRIMDPAQAPDLLSPANGEVDVDLRPELSWSAIPQAGRYQVQVASDAGFMDIVADESVTATGLVFGQGLEPDTPYFWRVRSIDGCDAAWSQTFEFHVRAAPRAVVTPDTLAFDLVGGESDQAIVEIANQGIGNLVWTMDSAHAPAGLLPLDGIMAGSLNCDTEPGLIIQDDGSYENGYGGNAHSMNSVVFVDRFTPSSHPAFIRAVCVSFLTMEALSANFEIVLFDNDGPGGSPGTELGAWPATVDSFGAAGSNVPVWTAVDISQLALTIESGSVYIGVRWAPPDPPIWIAADLSPENPPNQGGGYWWNDSSNQWVAFADLLEEYRAFLIRPLMGRESGCSDPGEVSWLNAQPASGTLAADDSTSLQVDVDSSGLPAGVHRASLCLFSNDMEQPLIPVPIELIVTENGVALGFEPATVQMAPVNVGDSGASRPIRLRNFGSSDATGLTLTLSGDDFTADTNDCAGMLQAGGTCTVDITLSPLQGGPTSGELQVGSDQGPDGVLPISGEGIQLPAHLEVDPEALSAVLEAGANETQSLTIRNLAHPLNEMLDWKIVDLVTGRSGSAPSGITGGHHDSLSAFSGVEDIRRPGAADLAGATGSTLPGVVPIASRGDLLNCDRQFGMMRNDDGSVENGYSGAVPDHNQVTIVDRLQPETYPAAISAVCLGWVGIAGANSVEFDLIFLADNGQGGSPGDEIASMSLSQTGLAQWPVHHPVWNSYDVSSLDLSVVSGAMYIGVRWQPSSPNVFLMADESLDNPAGYGGGYHKWGDHAQDWLPIQANFPDYRAMFIRALIEIDCTIPSWITVSRSSGSVQGGADDEIDVGLDGSGLAPGRYDGNLCLVTSDPRRSVTFVPVTLIVEGEEAGPAELEVAPASLDFGETETGTLATALISVTNSAPAPAQPLVLSAIELLSGAPHFAVTAGDCEVGTSLATGESCAVSIAFQPDAEQAYGGVLRMQSTDGQSATVGLSGIGVEGSGDVIFYDRFE